MGTCPYQTGAASVQEIRITYPKKLTAVAAVSVALSPIIGS
jgi:hypothetical protein